MTVNEFHQEIKTYGNNLLSNYGLDDCIETCGQFRSDKNLTFCLKFHEKETTERCTTQVKSIQLIKELDFFSSIINVRTDAKHDQLEKYIREDEQAFLEKSKKELSAFLDKRLSIEKFWGHLILLKNS